MNRSYKMKYKTIIGEILDALAKNEWVIYYDYL